MKTFLKSRNCCYNYFERLWCDAATKTYQYIYVKVALILPVIFIKAHFVTLYESTYMQKLFCDTSRIPHVFIRGSSVCHLSDTVFGIITCHWFEGFEFYKFVAVFRYISYFGVNLNFKYQEIMCSFLVQDDLYEFKVMSSLCISFWRRSYVFLSSTHFGICISCSLAIILNFPLLI